MTAALHSTPLGPHAPLLYIFTSFGLYPYTTIRKRAFTCFCDPSLEEG
jgi:hypothetical protein